MRPALPLFALLLVGGQACALGREGDPEVARGLGGKADETGPVAPPPFMIVGHRGSPWSAVENTLPSFTAALREGANAIELDLCVTADDEVVVWHDCNPDDPIALARQAGFEALPHIPEVPGLDHPYRTNIRNLTLDEVREHYGYAENTDLFDNAFDADRVEAWVPTLDEVAEWSQSDDGRTLGAIFLDIKLTGADLDLLPVLQAKIVSLFGTARFAVFAMSPHEPVVSAMRDWFADNAPAMRDGVIFDFEGNGALDAAHRLGLHTVSTGKTPLRSWSSYRDEVARTLDGARAAGVDTVVAWTIDDESRLLELLDLGVDGILTNLPGDLARLADRGWDDHDRVIGAIAECFAAHEGSDDSALCASGPELALFGPLREGQLVARACGHSDDRLTRDVFGCGGAFDAQNVFFDTDVLPGPDAGIWWNGYAHEVLVSTH